MSGHLASENAVRTVTARVTFYSKYGKEKEFAGQVFTKETQNTYTATVNVDSLDRSLLYAVVVKPSNGFASVFCLNTQSPQQSCTSPGIVISPGTNLLDFRHVSVESGDIDKQDGIASSYDMTRVLTDFGKTSSGQLETDLNGDGTVNKDDYAIVVAEVSMNKTDATIPFRFVARPQPTTATQIPTQRSATSTPTPPVATNTPINTSPTSMPTPTITVYNTPVPSLTPTPTVGVQSGKCKAVVNGKIYVSSIIGSSCTPITNEESYKCVQSQSECTPAACVAEVKNLVNQGISQCGYSGMASLDTQKTQIQCVTTFEPGPCTPPPPEPADCSDSGPSC